MMRTYLTEWRGDDGRLYGGVILGSSWQDAEQHCPPGVTVVGEFVATVEVASANVHPESEVMQ